MSRSDSAQILIAIRGGVEAARQAAAVAASMDDVGDQTREAGEDALGSAAAFEVLSRELDRTKRKMDLVAVSSEGMSVAVLGLSAHYLPALANYLPTLGTALKKLAINGGIFAGAFAAGAISVVGSIELMGKAIEGRYKATFKTAGTAAYTLAGQLTSLKKVVASVTAPGSDKALGGIAAGLKPLAGLLKSLKPEITPIGAALGNVFRNLGKELAGMQPRLKQILKQVPAAIEAIGKFAGTALALFVRLAEHGIPLVVKGLQFAGKLAGELLGKLTDKRIGSAIKNISLGNVGRPIQQLIGFVQKVGPVFAKVFGAARGYIDQVIDALKPAQPFLQNVIIPLLIGVGKGLQSLIPGIKLIAQAFGLVGKAVKPLRQSFILLGQVIAFVFGGDILKAIGEGAKLIPFAGRIGDAFSLLGRTINGVGRVFGAVLGKIVGELSGVWQTVANLLVKPVSKATVAILGHLGHIVSFVGSLPGKLAKAGANMFHWLTGVVLSPVHSVITLLDSIIKKIGNIISLAGKITSLPGKILSKISGGLLYTGGIVGRQGGGHIKGYAAGGFTSASTVLVGERGPELATLPVGTKVTPNDQTMGLLASRPTVLYDRLDIDGRTLFSVMRRIEADHAGRA